MDSNEVVFCEKLLNGMLSQGFTPATLVTSLHNVLGRGKGHEKAKVCINQRDEQDFGDLIDSLSEAITFARRIEGCD